MRCEEFCSELARWLEAVWDIEAPEVRDPPVELLLHARECPGCRVRLEDAMAFMNTQTQPVMPSPFLAAAVKERLTGVRPSSRKYAVPYRSTAAALAVVLIALGLILGPLGKNRGSAEELIVRFTLEAPGAEQVYVVGDWNEWDAAADPLMDNDSDGIWETEIKLEPGREYRYQFFVDNSEWIADPKTPLKIDDGFGGKNSILRI